MVVGGRYSCVVIHRANVSKQIGKLTHVANTQLGARKQLRGFPF